MFVTDVPVATLLEERAGIRSVDLMTSVDGVLRGQRSWDWL